jgi:hypothetical protein
MFASYSGMIHDWLSYFWDQQSDSDEYTQYTLTGTAIRTTFCRLQFAAMSCGRNDANSKLVISSIRPSTGPKLRHEVTWVDSPWKLRFQKGIYLHAELGV